MRTYVDTTGVSVPPRPQPPNGVRAVKGGDLMHASKEWANRPKDQAVYTMAELLQRTKAVQASARTSSNVPWAELRVAAHDNGRDLCLTRGAGAARFTNWSLGQLCSLPSSDGSGTIANQQFLGKLTPQTAAIVLNERLQAGIARKADAQLLFARQGDANQLRAITTDKYTRVWDAEIVERLAGLCERGTWQPAEAYRTADADRTIFGMKAGNALPLGWVSDRDMFVVLVDYDGAVEVAGSRYARFVMLSHSEVGDGALWLMWGLFDGACANFIMWGCRDVYEVNLRHSRSINEKWAEIGNAMKLPRLSSGEQSDLVAGITLARNTLLADNDENARAVIEAATKLPKGLVADAYELATNTPRYGDPKSIWGAVNGLTEVSQRAAHTDRRVQIDVAAARLMSLLK